MPTLAELQASERELGTLQLRTLLSEFADTLERLPKMRQEVETWMQTSGIDHTAIAQRLEPQLLAAADWLLDFDMLPPATQENPALHDFMQRAMANVTSRTIATMVNKYEAAKQESKNYSAIKRTKSGLIDNENGTVTDPKTGLMWKRVMEGTFTWNDAVEKFKGCDRFAGYNDWRLPTIAELKTLILPNEKYPAIDLEAFPNGASDVWSGSPYASSASLAWYVFFYLGGSNGNSRVVSLGVRLVRGGQ